MRELVEPQHPLRGVVDELQPALRIDDDDAFDHAGEDRLHPRRGRAPARASRPPELLHRVVERPRHRAQLVVAVVEPRRRAGRRRDTAARPPRCARTRLADPPGHDPGDGGAPTSASPSAVSVTLSDRPQLLADVGQRQRHAHECRSPDG